MKRIPILNFLLVLLPVCMMAVSCSSDDNAPADETTPSNIVETAQVTDELTSLVSALAKADEREGSDLVGTLSGNGPFTVFAPTNQAFTDLLAGLDNYNSLDDFDDDADRQLLSAILTYHVIAGVAAPSTGLTDGQVLATVQGENLSVDLDGGVFINDATTSSARVVLADVETSNGIVHIVDKVLVPQAVLDAINDAGSEESTLVDLVVATESLSILEAAVIKAGLATTLSGEGPFTVLAPTDDAFIALLDLLGDDYNSLDDFDTDAEIQLLTDVLLYHVIPSEVLAQDLAPGSVGTALADNSIEVIASGDSFVIGDASETDANITATDILASNGVAHTIDKVLLPQSAIDFAASLNLKTIVEIAVETDDLSLLVGALQQADAGLVEALSGEGPFTVFAPTNEAFAALLDALGDSYNSLADFDTEAEKDLLVKVLTYHVVPDIAAFSGDLTDGQAIASLQGENLGVVLDMDTVRIDDATDTNATVVIADVEASNGVVHVIDKVLLPQEVLDLLP